MGRFNQLFKSEKKETSNTFSVSNITLKLYILSFIVFLPFYGLVVYTNIEQRRSATEYATNEGGLLLQNLNREFENIIEGSDVLLRGLAQTKEIHANSDECNQFLASVKRNYKRYLNLGLTNLNGDLICSALPIEKKTNFSTHSFFRGVIEKNKFSVGRFRIGSTTQKATVYLGYPVNNINREIEKVLYVSLDLAWLADRITTTDLPKETVFSAFDKEGNILIQYPDQEKWVGKNSKQILDTFKANQSSEIKNELFEAVGVDGISRFYTLTALGGSGKEEEEEEEEEESPIYLSLGFSSEFLFDRADDTLKRNIIGLMLVSLVGLILIYFAGKALIVKRFEVLKELERLKSEFISIASHQLRTPLTTVSWYTERLIAGDAGGMSEKQNTYLNEIYSNSQRMVELIGAFLNISRIELGTMAVEPEDVDVVMLANSVIGEQKSHINRKRLKFISTFEENIPRINTDSKLIRVVLQNLLSNAVKYTPDQGRIEFAITLGEDSKNIQIRVADNGYGISKDQQDKIFSKFFRAKNIKEINTDGIGLGLYIVKSIVNQFGGNIWFESEENEGTVFYVTLPFDMIITEKV